VVNRYVPNEEVARWFAAADVAALPYREATGSGIAQVAFGAGVPVIATRTGGLEEVVEEGISGLLVPPRDPRALADTIAVLLSNPELCRKMAAASREKAEREFGVDGVVRQTMQLYSKLVGEDLYLRTLTAAAPKASCART